MARGDDTKAVQNMAAPHVDRHGLFVAAFSYFRADLSLFQKK